MKVSNTSLYDALGYTFYNYGWAAFCGVRERAANICYGDNKDTYTVDEFLAFYPIFRKQDTSVEPPVVTDEPIVPVEIIQMFVDIANEIVAECKYGEKMWRYLMGLVVAHFLTLYINGYYPDGSATPGDATAGGSVLGLSRSATLGDASVTFDNDLSVGGVAGWGTWNATSYGQIYSSLARLSSIGGSYVI